MPESLILNYECRTYTTSRPSFSLGDSGAKETRACVKITPRDKDETRRGERTRARVSLALLWVYYP